MVPPWRNQEKDVREGSDDMRAEIESSGTGIAFGRVHVSEAGKRLQRRLNDAVLAMLGSLPATIQTDALCHFVRHFHTPIAPAFDYFSSYYAPAWSILHWLKESGRGTETLISGDMAHAVTAHAMALLLHPLDDHLNDGQIPASHTALMIRSQSWMNMQTALARLTDGRGRGAAIVGGFMERYCAGIGATDHTEDLDRYCETFRDQMATWLIVPALIAEKRSAGALFCRDVETAYGSFGIAWRLLDDIRDVRADHAAGAHSAVYACLSKDEKAIWDVTAGCRAARGSQALSAMRDCIQDRRIVERLRQRICDELSSAAATAQKCDMGGWAAELRSLSKPLTPG
jgi:hypothetical protein